MKHFKRSRQSKAQRLAQRRNFTIYRLNGMMGNLGQMMYDYSGEGIISSFIEEAMDAIYALRNHIKEGEQPRESISINTAFLLHGMSQKLSDHYTKLEQ